MTLAGVKILGAWRVIGAVSAVLMTSCSRSAPPDPPQVFEAREGRQTPVAELAPRTVSAPTPDVAATTSGAGTSPLPLLGEDGTDAYGWPRRYVDRVALRALLFRDRFAELTRAVEGLQDAFEQDQSRERWPDDAADALGTAEKKILPKLDAWVAASPESFAPYLARGTHWVHAAYARRGSKWANDTADSDFAAMNDALAHAIPDLERALKLRPGLVVAMNKLINASRLMPGGRKAAARLIDSAIRSCPTCFLVDLAYLQTLVPRWGGSYGQMRSYAQRRAKPKNPRSALLLGVIDIDKAAEPDRERRYKDALAHVERACKRGEYWKFIVERADLELAMSETDKALADLDRAMALRPGHPEVLFARARALGVAKRYEDAGRDLRAGIAVDPVHWRVRSGTNRLLSSVVQGLMVAGWDRYLKGDREGAIRDYDLAVELDPGNHEVQGRRETIIWDRKTDSATLTTKLAVAQNDPPDDFRALQQLDYQLAREGRFGPIVGLWTKFLEKHPNHGPAYLERGGTYFRMGKRAESLADARKACDLGVSEGCVRAKQIAAMP
jgi:tetratricopeptide (TPR) repeat protein